MTLPPMFCLVWQTIASVITTISNYSLDDRAVITSVTWSRQSSDVDYSVCTRVVRHRRLPPRGSRTFSCKASPDHLAATFGPFQLNPQQTHCLQESPPLILRWGKGIREHGPKRSWVYRRISRNAHDVLVNVATKAVGDCDSVCYVDLKSTPSNVFVILRVEDTIESEKRSMYK